MSFKTFLPCHQLRPFIRAFAISESEVASDYKVLPGTSIVMGFQYSGALSYSSDGQVVPLSAAGITGLNDTFRIFSNANSTNTLLVTFTEAGAGAFFKLPLHELFAQSYSLDNIILKSQMDLIVEQLCAANTDNDRISVIEKFLLSRLDATAIDGLVEQAVNTIKLHNGNIKIAALAQQLYISQSRFEKRFRSAVGASPKKFASIVRLNSVVGLKQAAISSMTHIGLNAGYFDQSHFIKDFRSFTGLTPEEYFSQQ